MVLSTRIPSREKGVGGGERWRGEEEERQLSLKWGGVKTTTVPTWGCIDLG